VFTYLPLVFKTQIYFFLPQKVALNKTSGINTNAGLKITMFWAISLNIPAKAVSRT